MKIHRFPKSERRIAEVESKIARQTSSKIANFKYETNKTAEVDASGTDRSEETVPESKKKKARPTKEKV